MYKHFIYPIEMLDKLNDEQLTALHYSCCRLRGCDWGENIKTVKYIFSYDPSFLYVYHFLVLKKCEERNISFDKKWLIMDYRGRKIKVQKGFCNIEKFIEASNLAIHSKPIFKEHDNKFVKKCINILET